MMAEATRRPRFLVKSRTGRTLPEDGFQYSTRGPFGARRETISFKVEPLFVAPAAQGGFAEIGGGQWYVVESSHEIDREENPWDFVYRAREERLGFAAADAPDLIEPDLLQQWNYENPTAILAGEASGLEEEDVCRFNPQNDRLPTGPEFGWLLRDDFSQLRSAREKVGEGKRRVRVAHVDTGYDDDHVTRPKRLNKRLQRNFVDGEDPSDARDPARRGLLRNPGHGPGTLSLLAGNVLKGVVEAGPLKNLPLGGAAAAEIVPLRVANSVVLFRTSAVARAFEYLTRIGAEVVSMSMGGLPSSAWTEAVNRAYDAGVVFVCAAGNNFGRLPTRFIVYPGRYKRVIAVCGVMADGRSYTRLPITVMQGNWGPRRKMQTALAAYTPNAPWAEIGCRNIVDMDGGGTSSATPQVAAAAALWLMHHDPRYPEGWMTVEAVRKALFDSAKPTDEPDRIGRGVVQARDALDVAPAKAAELDKTPEDRVSFALVRLITGLGVSRTVRSPMFELEAAQLLQMSHELEQILVAADVDPDDSPGRVAPKLRQELVETMAADPRCSATLRAHLEKNFLIGGRRRTASPPGFGEPATTAPKVHPPSIRPLRTYAFDPSLDLALDTAVLNKTTIEIPWEELEPGPVGDYLEVVDIDPASGCAYAPVDLDDPYLLARQGFAPSEGNPQFHQQMVYAVAMRTIQNFEKALGRTALWSSRRTLEEANGRRRFRENMIRRLRIYPHALREANAYYSPRRKALLFGYFPASRLDPGRNLPGGMVFTCLSHDIVAHETTHALLDGMHRRFAEPSNPDVLAFHEAFADIVALFQHFSFPEALRHQIAKTRGDLAKQNLLGELAQQFGEAIGNYGALRDAIGRVNPETRQWEPLVPNPNDYLRVMEPHARGAILVAAVFDAFLAIYKSRSRDLVRLATGGTGILPVGDIHPDLVNRLADEAAKSAQHVLNICIRALDYCPPVDITFGEYLRALITADSDLVPSDPHNYRIAFVEAFRRRGIYPDQVRTLAVDSLRWRAPSNLGRLEGLEDLLEELDLSWDLLADRREAFAQSVENCRRFHIWATKLFARDSAFRDAALRDMGLAWGDAAPSAVHRNDKGEVATEVHAVRPARRLSPDGSFVTELVVEVTQRRTEPLDPKRPNVGAFQFRGGSTLLIDPKSQRVRYCIRKDILNEDRLRRQRRFAVSPGEASLHATYFKDRRKEEREPFAFLHRGF